MSGGVLCPSGLGLAGRGWRVDACWARGGLTVVGGSGAGGEGGRNVEIRGTAAQCSWSCRSDGVEFYMYQPLGSTHLGCLAGWSLQIAPSATSVRQRSSVRSCRGAALGRLAPRGLKDAVVPLGGGALGQPVLELDLGLFDYLFSQPKCSRLPGYVPTDTIVSVVWSLVSRGAWSESWAWLGLQPELEGAPAYRTSSTCVGMLLLPVADSWASITVFCLCIQLVLFIRAYGLQRYLCSSLAVRLSWKVSGRDRPVDPGYFSSFSAGDWRWHWHSTFASGACQARSTPGAVRASDAIQNAWALAPPRM